MTDKLVEQGYEMMLRIRGIKKEIESVKLVKEANQDFYIKSEVAEDIKVKVDNDFFDKIITNYQKELNQLEKDYAELGHEVVHEDPFTKMIFKRSPAIRAVCSERIKQFEKGFTIEMDDKTYPLSEYIYEQNKDLISAAYSIANGAGWMPFMPKSWRDKSEDYCIKLLGRAKIDRLRIASTLMVAALDLEIYRSEEKVVFENENALEFEFRNDYEALPEDIVVSHDSSIIDYIGDANELPADLD